METMDEDRFVNAVTYRPTTGEVVAIYSAYLDSIEVMSMESGFPFVVGDEELISNVDLYFVKDGEIFLRPAMPVERRGTHFSNVPPGTLLFVDGALIGPCEDGFVDLEISAPGRYIVRMELFPFQSYEVTHYES